MRLPNVQQYEAEYEEGGEDGTEAAGEGEVKGLSLVRCANHKVKSQDVSDVIGNLRCHVVRHSEET